MTEIEQAQHDVDRTFRRLMANGTNDTFAAYMAALRRLDRCLPSTIAGEAT